MHIDLKKILDYIIEENNETNIHEQIQDLKTEFIDDGWEDEYEDLDEAYDETGRGGAESQVVNTLIRTACKTLNVKEPDTDPYCEIYDALCEEFNVSKE